MPKQKGLVKIEGSLDDITFFKRKDAFLVRLKGGVSKERIMTDPAYKRTRENMSEFTNVVDSGKYLRNGCSVLVKSAFDGTLSNRLVRTLSVVKNLDSTSIRGERKVAVGIETAAGKQELKGFDFNFKSPLSSVLFAPYALDTANGEVTINGLVPLDMLNYPPHATHVAFRTAFMNLDFGTGISAIRYSDVSTLPLDMHESNVSLVPSEVPPGGGDSYFLLLVEFMQEMNGILYALNDGNYNSLTLLEVV
ncbi:hypothetical protein [Flavobacterium capsici]|uniref:Uncharacterized protein n=1 Tax=Flavobacterium capsici TaxID=3075618 RepID=A0AA96J1M8_9FLAO|nr:MULTISPECIES: hypothetical protein [unclassified Flavobacterium]WNM18045.1 hypothetical protein RN608_08470 [Flavobacterium sp. PMR2A8]WNM22097.1 hypothetical protein RN605_01770 [Flavobacterium sp. PMTSA4]